MENTLQIRSKNYGIVLPKEQRKIAEKIFKKANLNEMTETQIEDMLDRGVSPTKENKRR